MLRQAPRPAGPTARSEAAGDRRPSVLLQRMLFRVPSAFSVPGVALPPHVLGFVRLTSVPHQIALCVLTCALFLLELVPLELQRRIVNGLIAREAFDLVLGLCGVYLAVVVGHGALKLCLNLYRTWLGEQMTRQLRARISAGLGAAATRGRGVSGGGVAVALIVSEVEPVGAFVGSSVSEPVLQAGILASVLAYMIGLQPAMALVVLALFCPQLVVVPLMQRAMNRKVSTRVRSLRAISADVVRPDPHDPDNAQRIQQIFELNMGVFRLKFGMNFVMNLTQHLSVIATLALGGWSVLNGSAEIGTLVAFVSGVGRLGDPWGDLVNYGRDLTQIQTRYALLTAAIEGLEGEEAVRP